METTKYEKYFVREPLHWNTFPPYAPRLLFDSKNHFPEMNFGIRYTYINTPIHMERPHAHDFDQFFCFMGTPEDLRVFDGEVEVHLGEEDTVNIINSTTVVFVPRGMIHCPMVWKRVTKPMMFINIVLAGSYTRSDQYTGYFDRIGLSAREITAEEAGRILGIALPKPAYLPDDYKVQEIYALENSIKMLINEKPIVKHQVTVGDAGPAARQEQAYECQMTLVIRKFSGDATKIVGQKVKIGKTEGVLIDREQHNELWWLSSSGVKKTTPQYEMILGAGKRTSRDELVKVAQSVA